jgi:hypothetical protein
MSGADELVELAKALLADLQDGISIKLDIAGRVLPVSIRLELEENDDD